MESHSLWTMQNLYGTTVHARLGLAQRLHAELGSELAADAAFSRMLAQAEVLEEELARSMAGLELGALCTACAVKAGGGCCSSFMAGENDALQLLLNLMAGVPVAIVREDGECCFLGERGCLLRFKPMFCLNYNCRQIKDGAGMARMQGLEQAAGRLLQQQYGLEQLLLEFLRQRGRLAG